MKILQVLPFFGPKFGGSYVSLFNISKELSARGHNVTVITTDYNIDIKHKESLEKYGVKVIPFKCIINFGLFLISPSMNNWLENNISYFDIIHLQTSRSYQNNVIHKYATKFDIPYILQARGSLPVNTGKKSFKLIYDMVWGKKLFNDAKKLIALTQIELEQYKSFGINEEKIEIVANGIDLKEFDNLPKKGNFKNKFGIKENESLILYLGQIHKVKGIQLLINAFSELLKNEGNVKLAIVGPNSGYLSELKKLVKSLNIENNVIFTGPIYGKYKLEPYVDADVYVLPSFSEGFPNTILEACACGTPVIATASCCMADFVNKIGYTINHDENELKNAILNSLHKNTKESQETNIKLLMKDFTLDITAEKIENIYLKFYRNGGNI
jgi:glycosyltransferase involved in cell wall biosynthesis